MGWGGVAHDRHPSGREQAERARLILAQMFLFGKGEIPDELRRKKLTTTGTTDMKEEGKKEKTNHFGGSGPVCCISCNRVLV